MKFRTLLIVALAIVMAATPLIASAEAAQTQLLYTFWGSAYEKEAQEGAIAMFNELNPDIHVNALHIPSAGTEYVAKLTAMAASNTNPDVGYMDVGAAFVWAKEGKFFNIFELMEEDESWSRDMYIDDIFYMYGDDQSFGSTSSLNPRMIFCNVDAFTDAGVALPPTTYDEAWTWDMFVETAKALTIDASGNNANSPDFDPEMIMQYGCYVDCSDLYFQSIMLDSNGADLLTEDGSKLALNSPEATEVYQALYDLIYTHHVSPIPVEMSTISSDIPTALKGRQAAMAISGQWILLDMAKMDLNYELGVLPKFKEARNIKQAGTRVIFSNTANPEAAWKLFKFLASPEGALNLYKDGLWMPVLKEWYENEELYAKWAVGNAAHPDSYKTVVADSLFNGCATPSYELRIANYAELNVLVRSSLDPVWLNSMTSLEEALDAACEIGNPYVQGFNPGTYHNSYYHKQ